MYANLVDINILHYFTTIHNFCNRFIYWITKTYTHSEQYSFLKGINSTLCTALNTENYLLNKLISYSIVNLVYISPILARKMDCRTNGRGLAQLQYIVKKNL